MLEFLHTNKKNDLNRQINKLSSYCKKNNIHIDHIYSDISSGIDFDRPHFEILLNNVFNNKIDTIYITYKDRLSRLSYLTMESILKNLEPKLSQYMITILRIIWRFLMRLLL